jgi:hypothetical protein
MPSDPVRLGLDQARTVARSGARHRVGGCVAHGLDVVSVDAHAGHGVRRCTIGDALDRLMRCSRHEVRVAVVLADEDRRHAPQRREVQRLVEHADVRGAVAEERHRHAIEAAHAGRERRPGRDGDAGPDDPVGAEDAEVEIGHVHRAALAAAVARSPAVQLGEEPAQIGPLGQQMTVPAVRRGHVVVGAKDGAGADCGRLLADVRMDEAGDPVLGEQPHERLLGLADQDHGPVHLEQVVHAASFDRVVRRVPQSGRQSTER